MYKKIIGSFVILSIILGQVIVPMFTVQAASLTSGSVALSDSRPSQASVTYTVTFSGVTTSATKCIQAQFATTPTGSTVPTAMVTTGADFGGSSNYVPTPASWTVDASVNGLIEITYATGETPASASGRTVVLTGITNGSTVNSGHYLQFRTFNNVDCSTSPIDTGTVGFIWTDGQLVSATVDPSLSFTVNAVADAQSVNGATTTITTTSTTVPFGTVSSSANAIGAQDLTVTTNSGGGYSLYARYTGQLNNGSVDLDNHTGTNASPTTFSSAGTASFGYTTNDSTLGTGTEDRFTSGGGNKWAAFTASNLEVAYHASAVAAQTTRVGYQVGVHGTTPAGLYTTTIILTATPTY
jgi:hypothetical protein